MRRTSRGDKKREAVIDPALEKTLLSLHAAMNLGLFWEAVQHLLAGVILPRNRITGSSGLSTYFQIEAA